MNGKIVPCAAALFASVAADPVHADGCANVGVDARVGTEADGTTRLRSSAGNRAGVRNEGAAGVTAGNTSRSGAGAAADTNASASAVDQGPKLGAGSQFRSRVAANPNDSDN